MFCREHVLPKSFWLGVGWSVSLVTPGLWFCKNLSVHTFRKPSVQGQPLHQSAPDKVSRGTHTAAWCLKTIYFVWHKICCMVLQKHWLLQSVQFSEVTSICLSYFAFFVGHTAPLFRMIPSCRNYPSWVYTGCFSVHDTSLSAWLFTKWFFHCSFSSIPLEGLCAYYCLRRTYAYLPVASWCLFHFPDNWWIWNTWRFCNSVFFTRSLKVYSCILFFLFLVYFQNL